MTRTIAERNAKPNVSTWGEYTLDARATVIGWGTTHFGQAQYIIARDDAALDARIAQFPKVRKMTVGAVFSAAPVCNGNGQNVGNSVRPELEINDVKCKKCRKYLGLEAV